MMKDTLQEAHEMMVAMNKQMDELFQEMQDGFQEILEDLSEIKSNMHSRFDDIDKKLFSFDSDIIHLKNRY